jgi:hypothetical protein
MDELYTNILQETNNVNAFAIWKIPLTRKGLAVKFAYKQKAKSAPSNPWGRKHDLSPPEPIKSQEVQHGRMDRRGIQK